MHIAVYVYISTVYSHIQKRFSVSAKFKTNSKVFQNWGIASQPYVRLIQAWPRSARKKDLDPKFWIKDPTKWIQKNGSKKSCASRRAFAVDMSRYQVFYPTPSERKEICFGKKYFFPKREHPGRGHFKALPPGCDSPIFCQDFGEKIGYDRSPSWEGVWLSYLVRS